jgi:hypothetical protein
LLIPAQPGPNTGALPLAVIPFTVTEITEYIAKGLREQLQGDVVTRGRVQYLTIERRRYSGAGLAPVRSSWGRAAVLAPGGASDAEASYVGWLTLR